MHVNLALVHEDFSLKKSFMDFTSTSGNEKTNKGAPSVYQHFLLTNLPYSLEAMLKLATKNFCSSCQQAAE